MSSQAIIGEFISRAQKSIPFQDELVPVGNELAAITRFANERGYAFTHPELEAFLEHIIALQLPEAEKAEYAAYKQRLAAGLIRGPTPAAAESEERIRTIEHAPGFVLDRRAVLAGELLVIRGVPALGRLIERMRSNLRQVFAPHDPLTGHEGLDDDAYLRLVIEEDARQQGDAEIGKIVGDLLEELGLELKSMRHEWPGLRVLLPVRPERAPGYYRNVQGIVLNVHRDTWYGGPPHQINLWAPLYDYAPGAGVKLFPKYFAKSIKNNTHGADAWRAALGLCVRPMCLEEIDESAPYFPELHPGDLVCFSSAQLHGSGVNRGPHARINLEMRLVHDDDAGDGLGAPNVDNHGHGEIFRGWHRPDRGA